MIDDTIIVGFCLGCGNHTELDKDGLCLDCFDQQIDGMDSGHSRQEGKQDLYRTGGVKH